MGKIVTRTNKPKTTTKKSRAILQERHISLGIIPMPPSLNALYRVSQYGHLYKTKQAKEYHELVRSLFPKPTYDLKNVSSVSLVIEADFGKGIHSDLDNLLKVALDSLQGVLYPNDRLIQDLHIRTRKVRCQSPLLFIECLTEVKYAGN